MKIILVTQRIEKIGKFLENRNNLDTRVTDYLYKIGYLPILVPNNSALMLKLIKNIKIKGILLSGGGDPRKKDVRQQIERYLIKYSINSNIPLVGICRGAQAINLYLKGKIVKIRNHVRVKHYIFFKNKKKFKVNSFHDYGIKKNSLSKQLREIACAKDGSIELFSSKKNKILGMMWHPEREAKIKYNDKKLIKKIFS